jgi:LmbE family N-acetylglucosaminyl deacetylase
MTNTIRRQLLQLVVAGMLIPAIASASAKAPDAAEIQLALKKLTVVGSAMYVAAHPDDENTAMLAYLMNERLVRTSYLAMTRGDGGQNLIGSEKGELLGVIRTQELLAARRIDSAEQYFTRALDFGFSKSPVETLEIWGHDDILADVVWNIRRFQPDVIVTRFPTTGEGGHGHHTASAMLAVEAFSLAGDPTRFPEQLRYVNVWQPKRIFWNRFSFTPIKADDPSVAKSLRVDLGMFNPLLGRAYSEIAGESRSMHKSQGFGAAERRGTQINYFNQLAGDPAKEDLFEGIDLGWSRYAGGGEVGKILQQAYDNYDPKSPEKSLPLLLQADAAMTKLGTVPAWNERTNPWLAVKRKELLNVIRACAGIAIDVNAADSYLTPGGELVLTVSVVNRSNFPFRLETVGSLYGNPSKGVGAPLKNNEPVKTEISIKLPDDTAVTQPYWLQLPMAKGRYNVADSRLIGLPENPPVIPLIVTLGSGIDQSLFFDVPVVYRWVDPVRGEQSRPVDVVPELTMNPNHGVYLFPDLKPRPVTLTVHDFGGAVKAAVALEVPAGWSVSPASIPVEMKEKGEEQRVTFTLTPPAGAAQGTAQLRAKATLANGKTLSNSLTSIDYPHIPAQRIFGESAARLVRVDVKKKGDRIGYVMGSGDDVPDALRQIGYQVDLITDEELTSGDLARYGAIVMGVRAYNTRNILKIAQPRLIKYAENGGTVVVQYNVNNGLVTDPGPYPFKVSSDRVTVEEAPVTMLAPDDPVLNTPNRIVPEDWNGWVQERGLYFTQDADPRYRKVIESHDPSETPKPGGELVAKVGKGTFVYTSYAWFRQLPAGVPGAYKLFTNLVSAGK